MNNKHLLWIGSVVPETYYNHICSMGYKNQQASRIAQLNIIRGLEEHYGKCFDYVSGPALPAYPKYKNLYIKPFSWTENGSTGLCASYLNIEYINRLFKAVAMKHASNKITASYAKSDEITVFIKSAVTCVQIIPVIPKK